MKFLVVKKKLRVVLTISITLLVAFIIMFTTTMFNSIPTTTTTISILEITKYFNITPLPCKPAWVKNGDWLHYIANIRIKYKDKELSNKAFIKVLFTNVSFNIFEIKSIINASSKINEHVWNILYSLFKNETLEWRKGNFIYTYPHRLPINSTTVEEKNGFRITKKYDRITGILLEARLTYNLTNSSSIYMRILLTNTSIKVLKVVTTTRSESLIQYISFIIASIVIAATILRIRRRKS